MEKFLYRVPSQEVPVEIVKTPSRKRASDEIDMTDASKKAKNSLDDTLLQSNFYSPLNKDDNGDNISSTKKIFRTRKPRIPPITLHQKLSNPKATYDKIQSWASKPVYFKQSGDVRYIYATEKDDFTKIKEQLNLIKFQWTSHKAEDDMYKKLVLKGVDSSYTEEDVYDDIKRQFSAVSKVKQLSKTSEDGQHIPMGVYVVYFEWNTILSVPRKVIKFCCYHKVSWEYMRKSRKNSLRQCYNCQRFGHHSSECGLQNRCVKCVEHHKHGECKRIKGTDDPVCCNCGKNHPASYRGCVKAQEYLKNFKKPDQSHGKSDVKRNTENINGVGYSRQTNRKLTYSNVVKQTEQQKTPKPKTVINRSGLPKIGQHARGPSEVSFSGIHDTASLSDAQGFSFITNEIKSLFGVPFSVMMKTVSDFMPVYRSCTNTEQRKLLLIEFMCKISP